MMSRELESIFCLCLMPSEEIAFTARHGQKSTLTPKFLGKVKAYFVSHISRASNIAFLLDIAQMSDLDFGLIQQNISIKKASFQYQGCSLSFKWQVVIKFLYF